MEVTGQLARFTRRWRVECRLRPLHRVGGGFRIDPRDRMFQVAPCEWIPGGIRLDAALIHWPGSPPTQNLRASETLGSSPQAERSPRSKQLTLEQNLFSDN